MAPETDREPIKLISYPDLLIIIIIIIIIIN